MGRIKLTIWLLLLGGLWLQPALARHQLESALPGHDHHHCLVCVLHLDGKQALPASAVPLTITAVNEFIPACRVCAADPVPYYAYAIRAPPAVSFFYLYV